MSTAVMTFDDPTVGSNDVLAIPRALAARGDDDAARNAYVAVLQSDPTHFQALTELARLAFAGGFRSAARTAYEQAVIHHPAKPMAHVNLANILREFGEGGSAKWHYMAALSLDPTFAAAHQGLALTLADEGDHIAAARHRDLGFHGKALVERPYRGTGSAPKVLLLVSACGGNVPTDGWLNDTRFSVSAIYADYFDLDESLPPHDLVFNAIGDADLCQAALERAVDICKRSAKPCLNPPDRVIGTGRADMAKTFHTIEGARTPMVRVLSSAAIRAMTDIAYPVLIRRPGYHTGQHFDLVESRIGLVATLDAFDRLGCDDLLMIDYMDARGSDGMARKYRVMFIDGELYPLHLAISESWKVHYFSSAMTDNADHRAEEKRFLDDPAAVIGANGLAVLGAIAARLGLHYAGIDFGLGTDGRILVFEVNATMVLIRPGAEPIWDYRRPAIERAFDAVDRMISRRINSQG